MSYSKIDPEFKAKWVAALRSGDYIQGRGTLRLVPRSIMDDMEAAGIPMGPSRADAQFCCLGVACDLSGGTWVDAANDARFDADGVEVYGTYLENPDRLKDYESAQPFARYNWILPGGMMKVRNGETLGFPFLPNDVDERGLHIGGKLANLNDDDEYTFDEIADWIEENL